MNTTFSGLLLLASHFSIKTVIITRAELDIFNHHITVDSVVVTQVTQRDGTL